MSDQKEASWDELSYRKIRNFCIYDVGKRTNKFNTRKEWDEMLMISISVITSALTAKIVATYYFKKVDGYVKEMCEMTEKNNNLIKAILHKFHGSSWPEGGETIWTVLQENQELLHMQCLRKRVCQIWQDLVCAENWILPLRSVIYIRFLFRTTDQKNLWRKRHWCTK